MITTAQTGGNQWTAFLTAVPTVAATGTTKSEAVYNLCALLDMIAK